MAAPWPKGMVTFHSCEMHACLSLKIPNVLLDTQGGSHLTKSGEAILADTGVLLQMVEPDSLPGAADSDTNISLTDYEFLSSYNWVDEDTPVIYVPGMHCFWIFNSVASLIDARSSPGLEVQRTSL